MRYGVRIQFIEIDGNTETPSSAAMAHNMSEMDARELYRRMKELLWDMRQRIITHG